MAKSPRHMALEHIQGKVKQAMGNRIKSKLPKPPQAAAVAPDEPAMDGDADDESLLRKLKAAGC